MATHGATRAAPRGDWMEVREPAPDTLGIVRARHWRRLETRRHAAVQPILLDGLTKVPVPRSGRVKVDVDPVSLS